MMKKIARLLKAEDGVSAVIVAICLVAMLGAALVSIDAGNVWQTRRDLITATDAAALDEARQQAFGNGAGGCTAEWADLLLANSSNATPISCTVTATGPGAGFVTVHGSQPIEVRFGGVFGIGDQTAESISSAMFGGVLQMNGLLPIGLCIDNPHVAALFGGADTAPADEHPAAGVHRIWYTKDGEPSLCSESPRVPGNWGWIDYNGGSNSNSELVYWLLNGYTENYVAPGDCDAGATSDPSDDGGADPCDADPGSSGGSLQTAMNNLEAGGPYWVVVFTEATGQGSNTEYDVATFAGVFIVDSKVTGAESERYIDFTFTNDLLASGNCCFISSGLDLPQGVKLCGVDHDTVSAAIRCAPQTAN